MNERRDPDRLVVRVGGVDRTELLAKLAAQGVQLNASAKTLFDDRVFDDMTSETVQVVERAVRDFGVADRATLSQIFVAAQHTGLALCPPITAPYMRLATMRQQSAPDSVLAKGRAPSGSITVASVPLRDDDEYPKGFYLRVIDGVPWLRGYRCTDQHIWSPEDRFAFRS